MSERYARTVYMQERIQWTAPKEEDKRQQLPHICVEADKRHEDDEWCRAYVHIEFDITDQRRHWSPGEAFDVGAALASAAAAGHEMDARHGLSMGEVAAIDGEPQEKS